MPDWRKHEADVQEWLSLSSTIASGNKAHDPSDGVDNRHHSESSFPLMCDAKATEKKSFSIKRELMRDWTERAALFGKSFGLPIRFEDETSKEDYIVVSIHDFAVLLDSYRQHHDGV